MSDAGLPIAGWYPDPSLPGTERFWDGHGWTAQVRAAGGASPPSAPPTPPSAPSTPAPPAAPGAPAAPAAPGAPHAPAGPGAPGTPPLPPAGPTPLPPGSVGSAGYAPQSGGQAPGWYADPSAPGMVRWWSGWSWVGMPCLPSEIGTTGRGLRDIGDLVTAAWEPIGRRIGDLGSMAMALLLPAFVVIGPLVWMALRDVEFVETSPFSGGWQMNANQTGFGGQKYYDVVGFGAGEGVLVAVAIVVLILVTALLWLGAARLLLGESQGVREHWGTALRAGAGRFWRVLGTGLAMGAIVLGAFVVGGFLVAGSALVPPLLLLTIPAWIVALLYVGFRLQLAVVAAAVAPLDVRPISDTWTLVGSKLLGVVGRLLVLGLLTSAVGWVLSIPVAVLQALMPGLTGLVVSMGLQMVVSLLTTVYVLSGSILIWQDIGGATEPIAPPA